MSKVLTFEAAYSLNSCLNEFFRSVVVVVNKNAFIQFFLMQLAQFEYYFDRTQRSSVFFHKSRSCWIRVSFFDGVNYILLRQLCWNITNQNCSQGPVGLIRFPYLSFFNEAVFVPLIEYSSSGDINWRWIFPRAVVNAYTSLFSGKYFANSYLIAILSRKLFVGLDTRIVSGSLSVFFYVLWWLHLQLVFDYISICTLIVLRFVQGFCLWLEIW